MTILPTAGSDKPSIEVDRQLSDFAALCRVGPFTFEIAGKRMLILVKCEYSTKDRENHTGLVYLAHLPKPHYLQS